MEIASAWTLLRILDLADGAGYGPITSHSSQEITAAVVSRSHPRGTVFLPMHGGSGRSWACRGQRAMH